MAFNIPQKIDDWLTIQYIIFFVIGFLLNVFANGQATLIYLNTDFQTQPYFSPSNFSEQNTNLSLNSLSFYSLDQKQEFLQTFANDTYTHNKFVLVLCLILYFIISPAVNFFYAFFIFKKGSVWSGNEAPK